MKKKDIIDAVLAILGPILRLLAMVLEPRAPNAARHLRNIGTITDVTAYALAQV